MQVEYLVKNRGYIRIEPIWFKVEESGTHLLLAHIYVNSRSREKGVGNELMAQLISDADREGVTLYLTVSGEGDMTNVALRKWYKRWGFLKWRRVSDPDPLFIDRPTVYRRIPIWRLQEYSE